LICANSNTKTKVAEVKAKPKTFGAPDLKHIHYNIGAVRMTN